MQAPAAGPPRDLLPPEEHFWQRYSRYHEFPLSTVGAIAIFVLSLAVLFLFSTYLITDQAAEPIELGGPIEVIPGGGGGGGSGNPEARPEAVQNEEPKDSFVQPTPLDELPRPKIDPKDVADVVPPDSPDARFIQNSTLAAQSLARAQANLRQDLMKGLADSGSGGGSGGNDGGGVGKSKGPGTGNNLSDRQKRVLRWTMIFDSQNGIDYRNQLQALGAILAVPGPQGQYWVIRDLARPKPQLEDIAKIQRIFWIDERAESVGPLMRALNQQPVAHVVAFFPEKLEKDLLAKELRFRNRPENEILETRFRVMRRGSAYEPMVVDQR